MEQIPSFPKSDSSNTKTTNTMIDVDVILTDKGIRKLSERTYERVKYQLLDDFGEETYQYILNSGEGVFTAGYNPTGGSPVWQGKVKLGHQAGALLRSHYLNKQGREFYEIGSYMPYAEDVIQGIRSEEFASAWHIPRTASPPKENPYHKRAVDHTIQKDTVRESLVKIMSREGLI